MTEATTVPAVPTAPVEAMEAVEADHDPQVFRARVRAWLDEHAPAKGAPGDFSSVHIVSATTRDEHREREHAALQQTRRWQRQLFDAGLAGRSWPTEYGGVGAPSWQDDVVAEEQARYGVSTKMLAVALDMLPPVLFMHGTHEQRAAHLPRVLRGEESWCQLLSEPGAGSDLASVSTRATAVDGGWVVTGQKVWTSGAGSSDHALLVARTGRTGSTASTGSTVPARAGLSCFVMAMSQPGVEVRPLRQMSGAYHFNEVFLDEAFVPEAGLVGDLGGAWPVLRTMLASERASIGGGTSARSATQLIALATGLGRNGDGLVRQLLAAAVTRERLLGLVQARAAAGAAVPAAGSVAKLLYSEHARLSADAALQVLGPAATVDDQPVATPWRERFLFAPGLRIGGGTDEIQRNTIAERGLGLPREPRP
jgi:alkylation response protein AidB-like acyl-CoA dehydrogenase